MNKDVLNAGDEIARKIDTYTKLRNAVRYNSYLSLITLDDKDLRELIAQYCDEKIEKLTSEL